MRRSIVLSTNVAQKLFGAIQPIDKWIRVGGRPMRVIGIYQEAANIFQPPGQEVHGIMPYRTMDRQYTIDKTNALFIPVKPRPGVTVNAAEEAVTIALREARRLRPGDHNNFDMITQDQILDTFNKITGVFFLVMIVLSGVALLVGGIGVMAVMMISVTDRTREIGIRKAVGATRGDILQQFLIEAAALTGAGGVIGVASGLALGQGGELVPQRARHDADRPDVDRGGGVGGDRAGVRRAPGATGGAVGSDRVVALRVIGGEHVVQAPGVDTCSVDPQSRECGRRLVRRRAR